MKIIVTFIVLSSALHAPLLSAKNASSFSYAAIVADSSDKLSLTNNKCLQQLNDNDEVVISVAFHDGAGGYRQLKKLIDRKPWGAVLQHSLTQEIDNLLKQQSPFLIATMTKKQALLLEAHRDLIKWILVQSTEKACT